MIEKMSKFTLRVNEETMKKFRYVAEYHARSTNKELEFLMKKHIAEYEKRHEKIILNEI